MPPPRPLWYPDWLTDCIEICTIGMQVYMTLDHKVTPGPLIYGLLQNIAHVKYVDHCVSK